ncbi:MAG: FkbM family methyltransferase, partial [Candidatus Nanohaloarchaea archaeon]|nr:FkbM family methyltransferase [Candidatus Nanohaloarchaea archaeon]
RFSFPESAMLDPVNDDEALLETAWRKARDYWHNYTAREVVEELSDEAGRRAAVRYHVDAADGSYAVTYDGEPMQLPQRHHFRELVDTDIIEGYTAAYDIAPGDTVIDAGAYPGEFTAYAARRCGPEGTVVALEPGADNRETLQAAVDLNGLDNVDIYGAALHAVPGTVSFRQHRCLGNAVAPDGEQTVEAVTLDGLVDRAGLDTVDFVKMDVEGGEIAALKGAGETLAEHRPHVAVASYHGHPHRADGTTSGDVEDLLREYGYDTLTGFDAHPTTWGIPRDA